MALRSLNSNLKQSLILNDEFIYAHLIKFEKPEVGSGLSTLSTGFSYLTDGPYNIVHDNNTYIANKVLSVGTVQETTEVKATNLSITLSGTSLGTIVLDSFSFDASSDTVTSTKDLLLEGLQEGDELIFENGSANNNVTVRVNGFSNSNKTIAVTEVSGTLSTESSTSYTASIINKELRAVLLPKSDTNYTSYIHREVEIWRAHLNPETGATIGEPYLLFRGIINKGSVTEDITKGTKVTWGLTSHWGDFVRIQGRMTSDRSHRAVGASGKTDPDGLVSPSYATDFGFEHSEKALNVMASYIGKEKRFKFKKSGFLGMGSGRTIEYDVDVTREVDLRFNLSAKYLPVVYGVQKVDSFPIFADTLIDDPATTDVNESGTVLMAFAICEGQIGGVYDIHVDDNSTVCVDQADVDSRSNAASTSVMCMGRADKGFVLKGGETVAPDVLANFTLSDEQQAELSRLFTISPDSLAWPYRVNTDVQQYVAGSERGIQTGETLRFTTPIPARVDIHCGAPQQEANRRLVSYSMQKKFKIQKDYYSGTTGYWTNSHRVLDTAYAVGEYTLGAGETTVPKYEFVVKGKFVSCYNYDGSYEGHTGYVTTYQNQQASNSFNLGDSVTFHDSATNTQIGSATKIIDKWDAYGPAHENHFTTVGREYRYRWETFPSLGTTKAFYMQLVADTTKKFYMQVAGRDQTALSVAEATVMATVTSLGNITEFGGTTAADLVLNNPSPAFEAIFANLNSNLATNVMLNINFENVTKGFSYSLPLIASAYNTYNTSTNTVRVTSWIKYSKLLADIAAGDNVQCYIKNGIKLSNTSSLSIAQPLTLRHSNGKESKIVVREISGDYISFHGGMAEPKLTTGDSILVDAYGDYRVTTNPAMQLLDYLISDKYGKGLNLDTDIDLESFLEAARDCDTRSDVTVGVTSGTTPVEGAVYKVEDSGGRLLFKGTILKEEAQTFRGTTLSEVTFTDVVGKLGEKWNDWKVFQTDDIVWHEGKVFRPTSQGTISLQQLIPFTNSTATITFTKTAGAGPATFTLYYPGTEGYATDDGNPVVRKFRDAEFGYTASGYSLYDSDSVKYWRMVGWEGQEQRFVTRHQMNQVVDTSRPIFSNVNQMLAQFNGILRYSNGRYNLNIEKKAPTTLDTVQIDGVNYTPARIEKEDIIGQLKIVDKQQKDTYNSISSSIIDPANKFGGREVTFFNSEYVKQDRGIKKSGNLPQPGITNYFNARINIKQFLDESRSGLTVSFKTMPKASMLLAGDFIELNHAEFGFSNKRFRISTIGLESNGLVNITATEYNEAAYILETVETGIDRLEAGDSSGRLTIMVPPPTMVGASTTNLGGVIVTWTHNPSYDPETSQVEIWRSDDNDIQNASLIATSKGTSYTDQFDNETDVTKYYWIRYIVTAKNPTGDSVTTNISFYPYNTAVSALSGWEGIAKAIKANNISYTDNTSLEALKPGQVGADNTSSQVNTGVTATTGGLTLNGGAVKSLGKDSASSSTAGYFMGWDGSAFVLGLGDATNKLLWNGTDLSVTGTITSTAGQIGGWHLDEKGISSEDVTGGAFTDSGYTTAGITIHNQGSIHAPKFFIDSDGSASFKGDISGATGTFSGAIEALSITAAAIADGAIGSDELSPESVSGLNINPAGTIAVYSKDVNEEPIPSTYAALDGTDSDYRLYAGDTASGAAPFRVTKEGKLIANNLQLFDANNNLYFDSATGFTGAAFSQIAQNTGTRVSDFSEVFTGSLNLSDTSTFEKLTLTSTTNVTTQIRIPVSTMSATASEEYFGTKPAPLSLPVDVNTYDGTQLVRTDINKPFYSVGGSLNRALKVGEIVSLNLSNTVEGMTLTSVTGAKNAITGSNFSLPLTIAVGAAPKVLFEIDSSSENFEFTVTCTGSNPNITMDTAENSSVIPDTLTAARNKIPTSVTSTLLVRTGSSGASAANVLAAAQFDKVYTTPADGTEYQAKTLSHNVLSQNTIHSTVGVVSGGAVDSQGYITRSDTTSKAAEDYWYYSALAVAGGLVDLRPTDRVFNASVPSASTGFLISSDGTATQGSELGAFATINMEGNMNVPSSFSILTPNGDGTVTIDGDLTITGTQTQQNTTTVTATDKLITVAAGATTAGAINGAGIAVDRTSLSSGALEDAAFLWDQTNAEWDIYSKAAAPIFRGTTDGTADSPVYTFGARSAKTGFYAVDDVDATNGEDQINVTTKDAGSNSKVSSFNNAGITSHSNVYIGASGAFVNEGGDWVGSVTDNNNDFKFKNSSDAQLLKIDSALSKVVIGSLDVPKAKLHIFSAASGHSINPSTSADDLLIESNSSTGMTFLSGTNTTQRINFADGSDDDAGSIYYSHYQNKMTIKAGGTDRVRINASTSTEFLSTQGGNTSHYSTSVADLGNNHVFINPTTREGATLTLSTLRTNSSTVKVTRGGIKSGPNAAGKGYGFLDLMVNNSDSDNSINIVVPVIRASCSSAGARTLINDTNINHNQSAASTLEVRSNKGSAHPGIIINNVTSNVGKGSSLTFQVENGSAYIRGIRGSADNGATDLVFATTAGGSSPVERLTIMGGGQVGVSQEDPKNAFQVQDFGLETNVTVVSAATLTTISSYSINDWRSCKFIVQMEDVSNNNFLISEILSVYGTSDVEATEFGVTFTGASKGVEFSVNYTNGTVFLKATCTATSASRKFTVVQQGIAKGL